MKKAIILLVLVSFVAACSVPPPPEETSVHMAPGLDLVLPSPGSLGHSVEATQLVTAHYGDRTIVFQGYLSANPERVLLVAIDSLGRKAMSISWDRGGVTYEAAPWLPSSLPPKNMLADLVVLYWPESVVRQAIARSGGILVETPVARSLSVGGREVIHIDYDVGADHWQGRAHYRNLPWRYELEIQTVTVAP